MKSRARNFVYSLAACLCLVTGGAIDAQVAQVMITSGTPPSGVVGMPYSFTFTATGPNCSDVPTFSWSATGLPSGGLSLSVTGNLSGTPTTPGPITFTVTATDNSCSNQTAQQQYTIAISASGQPANTTAYISQSSNLPLEQVAGGAGTTFGSAPCGSCNQYTDIARDTTRGNLIVAAGSRVAIYSGSGSTPSTFTSTQLMALNPALFSNTPNLVSVAVDGSGNYIVVDNSNQQIVRITANASGNPTNVTQIASFESYDIFGDAFVRLDSSGNYILAIDDNADDGTNVDLILIAAGSASVNCAPGSPTCTNISINATGNFPNPASVGGLTLDGGGNYVITDFHSEDIYSISPTGAGATLIYNGSDTLSDPLGISYDPLSGDFFFVDDENSALYTLGPSGCTSCTLTTVLSGGALSSPEALVVVDTQAAPGTILFDLSSLSSQSTPASQTVSGLTATFSSPADPGGFAAGNPGVTIGTNVLYDPGSAGASNIPLIITFSQAIASVSLSFATDGGTGAFSLNALSGTASVGSSSATGTIPNGGSFPQGVISFGTTAAGGFNSIALTSPNSPYFAIANVSVTLGTVAPLVPALTITVSPSSISTTTGGSVSATFSASGGSGSYTYSVIGQPAGVTVGPGSLSGTPTLAGIFNATVTVNDTNQNSASALITINVLGLTTTSLPNGTTGQPYATSIGAAGGTGSFSFSVTGLPAGLSLTNYGYLTGTVKTAGTYPIGVTVSSGGLSVTTSLSLTIANAGPLSISSAALPSGTVNVLYSQSLGATGGLPPYTWSVITSAPPQGLSMNASGVVSGTPTSPGSFSFGVQVTDTAGAIATATATLAIQAAPLTITSQSLPLGMNGVDYPQQQLAVSGGVSPYTWALSSGSSLPSGMVLSSSGVLSGVPTVTGTFSVGVAVTDHASAQGSATLSLTIRATSPDLILTSSTLSFALASPAASTPASQMVGVQATVPSHPIAYTVSVNPPAPWLALANGATTPDSITASLTAAALALSPGPYQTMITATCASSVCNGDMQTVTVNLTVTATPPQLLISTGLLSFATANAAAGTLSQPIDIQNAGGGSLGFASISCEAPWCTAGPLPTGSGGGASLAGGVTAAIPVTVDPSSLSPGFYRTQVDIATSGGKGSVPVTLFISANATLTLSPAGTLFNTPAGSAPGNSNGSFLANVNSSTAVNFTAAVIAGASFITLQTTSGSASSTQPGTVSFSLNTAAVAGLAPGAYYGEIQISSAQLSNSPETFEVVLNVAAANSPVVPDPEPGGLLFITTAGGVLPPETVTVYSSSAGPLTFQASAASGGNWLSVTPATGSASATSPGVTTVSVNTSGLNPGVYLGGINYSLSATAIRTVNVTLIVSGTGGSTGASAVSANASPNSPRAAGCTPSMLVPAQTGLVNSFSQPAGWPTPLQIVLANDCGATVSNGQVVATFSNGDPPLALTLANPSQGLYAGTWSPARPASQVTINVTANAPGFPAATSQIAGAVSPNAVPLLTPNSTLHVFNSLIGGALAPGTIVAIYGQNLAAMTAQPTTIPLPTTFNGTSVIVGGMQAPLYFVSAGQVNAQIPFELAPGNQYEVIVSANGALTTPQPIQLSAATPGLAAFSDGTLIAQHSNGTLVSQAAPAMAGEYLVAYLAGLGDTTVPVASGAASPSSPLAQPSNTPVLTINGAQSPILFAGLTPGLVGLYQMNFQAPTGLPAGNITIAVSQNGQSSNQTFLPYQP